MFPPFPNQRGDCKFLRPVDDSNLAERRKDRKELYYLDPDGKVTAVALKESNGSLQVAAIRALFPDCNGPDQSLKCTIDRNNE